MRPPRERNKPRRPGGGSFVASTDSIQVAGTQTGDGEVVINTIFVGTPGKPNCHGEAVSNLAKQYGGLDAAATTLGSWFSIGRDGVADRRLVKNAAQRMLCKILVFVVIGTHRRQLRLKRFQREI